LKVNFKIKKLTYIFYPSKRRENQSQDGKLVKYLVKVVNLTDNRDNE